MKNKIGIILYLALAAVLCISLSSCSLWDSIWGKDSDDGEFTFEKFCEKFKKVSLPFNIDDYIMIAPNSSVVLDSTFIAKYIEKNRRVDSLFKEFDIYKYIPIAKFKSDKKMQAIIYLKQKKSGGIEDNYFLNIYNSKGRILSTFLLAFMYGDCKSLYESHALITKELGIYIDDKIISFDSDCQSVILDSLIGTRDFKIKKDGKIVGMDY